MLEASILIVFPFCMAFAAISDMLSMTIANRIPVFLVATFAIVAPLTGMDWQAFGMHFATAGMVLAVTFGLFAVGAMGGGDAKLLAATSLWFGFGIELVEYLVTASFLGGMLTVALLSLRKSTFAAFMSNNMFLRHLADAKVGIPYGIALGIGGLMAFPSSPLMVWAFARITAN